MTRTCVASEYGVVEFSSTNCEPNIGRANLLSVESMIRIVSCLGTMLKMVCFLIFNAYCVAKIFIVAVRRTRRTKKNYENAQNKIQSLHAVERCEGKKIYFFPRLKNVVA